MNNSKIDSRNLVMTIYPSGDISQGGELFHLQNAITSMLQSINWQLSYKNPYFMAVKAEADGTPECIQSRPDGNTNPLIVMFLEVLKREGIDF